MPRFSLGRDEEMNRDEGRLGEKQRERERERERDNEDTRQRQGGEQRTSRSQ